MLQFPKRYRPHVYIITGIIMVILSAGFVRRIPFAVEYLFFTNDPVLLIATCLFALTAWGIGVTEIYHGFFLFSSARRYKPVAFD